MGKFCTNLRIVNEVVSDVLRAKYFIDIILFESKESESDLDDLQDLRKAQQLELGVHAITMCITPLHACVIAISRNYSCSCAPTLPTPALSYC